MKQLLIIGVLLNLTGCGADTASPVAYITIVDDNKVVTTLPVFCDCQCCEQFKEKEAMPRIPERDPNHAKCAICKQYKEHIDSGIINPSGKLTFIADKGTPWQGKVCPDCVDQDLNSRNQPGQKVIPQLLNINKQPRVCKECEYRILPVRRARVCEICKPSLDIDLDEDFLYHDSDE